MKKLALAKTSVIALSLFLAACGGGSSSSSPSSNISSNPPPISAAVSFSLLAGSAGGSGNVDGIGATARFTNPSGTAVDSSGNVYVADTNNYTIRKITPTGIVTTLAGTAGVVGTQDGIGTAATFTLPRGITVDSQANVYVTDNGSTLRKITPSGVVTTLAGTAGVHGTADGTGATAQFNYLTSLTIDNSSNNIYATDGGSNTIRKITQAGVVTTLTNGVTSTTQFSDPQSISIDTAGNLYVLESFDIIKVSSTGVTTTLMSLSPGLNIQISNIAVGNNGYVYASNIGVWGIQSVIKIDSLGAVTVIAGGGTTNGSMNGAGATAQFSMLSGLSVDGSGNIYVADSGNNEIRKVTSQGVVTTLAGAVSVDGNVDNIIGSSARFNTPNGVTADSDSNIYVADSGNAAIRKITANGVVTTLAGGAGVYTSVDGVGTAASFSHPVAIVADNNRNLYITDSNTIRKITPSGVVSTIAGSSVQGYADGTGIAAQFNQPQGIAVDSIGNIYVADSGNQVIRKITSSGVVTTIAGSALYSGIYGFVGNLNNLGKSVDGAGSAAVFWNPTGIAVDSSGNLYIADTGSAFLGMMLILSDQAKDTIRKITPAGVVTTIAGTAGVDGNIDGIGTAALFRTPKGLAVDINGNVYVADSNNGSIRRVTPNGVVSTVVKGANTSNLAVLPNGNLVFDSANAIFTTAGL